MTDGRPRPVKLRPSWTRIAFFAALGPIILAMIALWIDSESKRGAMMRTEFRQSIEYQRELAQLFSLLKDAETGERGYLLTGDRSFLEPYERGTRYTPAPASPTLPTSRSSTG
jgi:CHASE3 domain sensor protein